MVPQAALRRFTTAGLGLAAMLVVSDVLLMTGYFVTPEAGDMQWLFNLVKFCGWTLALAVAVGTMQVRLGAVGLAWVVSTGAQLCASCTLAATYMTVPLSWEQHDYGRVAVAVGVLAATVLWCFEAAFRFNTWRRAQVKAGVEKNPLQISANSWFAQAVCVCLDLLTGNLGEPSEPQEVRSLRSKWVFAGLVFPPWGWLYLLATLYSSNPQGSTVALYVGPALIWVVGYFSWLVRVYGKDAVSGARRYIEPRE